MSYTPIAHVATGDLATAALHNTELDVLNGIGAGTQALDKVKILGAAAPSVSASGYALIIYNSTSGAIEASVNGAAFAALGTLLPADPYIFSGWFE